MANPNAPRGLRFYGLMGSPVTNASLDERRNSILSSNTGAIYTGDLIRRSANGYLYQYTVGTAVSQVWGVFAGCRYASNSQQTVVPQKYWPGTDAISGSVLAQYVPSLLTPTPLFIIQTDATGVTQAEIGLNFDVAIGTGSAITGFSGMYLDTTTSTTAATVPLRLIDLYANVAMGNNPEGAGSPSSLAPGTEPGAYNLAVVAINNMGTTGL